MMRSAGIFILAFVGSAVAGIAAFAAVSLLPDWDDAAGRGLGEAFLALMIAVYVLLGVVLFGLAAWRSNPERHMKRALATLLLIPVLIVVLGVLDNGIGHINWLREAVGAVQMFTPLWIVALVQWLILRHFLLRRTAPVEAASA